MGPGQVSQRWRSSRAVALIACLLILVGSLGATAGAATIDDLRSMLTEAGFVEIRIHDIAGRVSATSSKQADMECDTESVAFGTETCKTWEM